ncbi:MAG: DUF3108 domain-containing protein [Oceanicaulis sp.]
MILTALGRAAGLAASLTLAALPAAGAQLAPSDPGGVEPPGELYVEYSGAVYFLSVADISLNARFSEVDYSAAATFQSAGLLRWFDDTNIEATAVGYRGEAGLRPYRYEHINYASDKGRVVGIDFPERVATPDVNPPFGSMGEPPASDEERAGALDPISVMLGLALAMPGDRDEPCSGTLPVFDGKARYDLRFENQGLDSVRTRAWRGDAVECHAYLEPISGYDPGDRPSDEETENPVRIWLAPINDVYVPVRFRAATQIGDINVSARRIALNGVAPD